MEVNLWTVSLSRDDQLACKVNQEPRDRKKQHRQNQTAKPVLVQISPLQVTHYP